MYYKAVRVLPNGTLISQFVDTNVLTYSPGRRTYDVHKGNGVYVYTSLRDATDGVNGNTSCTHTGLVRIYEVRKVGKHIRGNGNYFDTFSFITLGKRVKTLRVKNGYTAKLIAIRKRQGRRK